MKKESIVRIMAALMAVTFIVSSQGCSKMRLIKKIWGVSKHVPTDVGGSDKSDKPDKEEDK